MFKVITKQSATQKVRSQDPSRPMFAHQNQGFTTSGILMLQGTIGNQAMQRIVQGQEQNADASSLVQKPLGSGHDFSRIPVHCRPHSASESPTMNEPEDRHEQEADRVAEQAISLKQPNPLDQRDAVSRNTESVHGSVSNNSSGGNTLPSETRQFFEPRFGHSFANVRVHSDGSANK